MGLDNGVTIKNVTRKKLPPFIHFPFDKDYLKNEVDICYWRKWWGLRNNIIRILHMDDETYERKLTRAEVGKISKLLYYFLTRDVEGLNHEYWDNEVTRKVAIESIWNLFWLRIYMRFHPKAEVYFYDSY